MRRTGKSKILKQWASYIETKNYSPSSNILYIECNSLEYANLTNWEDLKSIILPLEKLPNQNFLLIDEIQNIEGWEIVI